MTVMSNSMKALGQELLSSVKVGWRVPAGRISLAPCDSWSQGELLSDIHRLFTEDGERLQVRRLGLSDADAYVTYLGSRLFSAPFACFSASSGSQANRMALMGLLQASDKVLCLHDLELESVVRSTKVDGGALQSIKLPPATPSGNLIDYEAVRTLALQTKPQCIAAGYSDYARFLNYKALRDIADEVGAWLLVDVTYIAGLIAAGLHPNPLHYADVVTGATNKSLQGPKGGFFMTTDRERYLRIERVSSQLSIAPAAKRLRLGLARCLSTADSPTVVAQHQSAISNARAMAERFKARGLTVLGAGTDTSSVIIDLAPLGLTQQQASVAAGRLGIALDRTAGGRTDAHLALNTYPISVRGLGQEACAQLADAIARAFRNPNDLKTVVQAIATVEHLCNTHPALYSAMDAVLLQ